MQVKRPGADGGAARRVIKNIQPDSATGSGQTRGGEAARASGDRDERAGGPGLWEGRRS